MEYIEINEVNNFDTWDPAKLHELRTSNITEALSPDLLFENDKLKLWEIFLLPKERIPFRRCKNSYSITAMTSGLAISRIFNGNINLIRIQKNDTAFWDFQDYNHICDFENIGEEPLRISVTEFKTFKEQKPIDLLSVE